MQPWQFSNSHGLSELWDIVKSTSEHFEFKLKIKTYLQSTNVYNVGIDLVKFTENKLK